MQQTEQRFIGRTRELAIFTDWLNNPEARPIFYIHDATEKPEKKGGIGKTRLLGRFQQLARQTCRDTAVVSIDFFNLADRDRVSIAERVITVLQEVYPQWSASAFTEILDTYRAQYNLNNPTQEQDIADSDIRDSLSEAITSDLQKLSEQLAENKKALLIFFDTFELVEQNPLIAVLGLRRTFPDNYGFSHIGIVIAGRNRINWEHPNWQGRQQEVQEVAIAPFNQGEMAQYLDAESLYEVPAQEAQLTTLHHLTEGRPILIGLTIDVLNHHTITFPELITVPQEDFEQYLIPQINKLENPLNWVIMFMAHTYHRFNMPILDWILGEPDFKEIVHHVQHQNLKAVLPTLSFVRRSSSGEDFVLHDEMRRLVIKYCWGTHDPDRRYRQTISRAMMTYYERQSDRNLSGQERLAYTIEMLYHLLFVDITEGLSYFRQQFYRALNLWNNSFARLLLQEAQQFTERMTNHNRFSLLLEEGRLLTREENPVAALVVLQELERNADVDWLAENRHALLSEMGSSYLQQSKLPEATRYYTECLALEKARNDERLYAEQLGQLAYIYRLRGEFDKAIEFYEEALALHKKSGRQQIYADTLNNMGNVYRFLGKTDEALSRCKIALRIRRELFRAGKIGERHIGSSLGTLGLIYIHAEDIVQAELYFREAMDIYSRIGYKSGIASMLNRLGQVEIAKADRLGDAEAARENLELAQQLFSRAEIASRGINEEAYTNSLNKQGRILARQNKRAESAEFYWRGIEHAKKIHDHYQQAEGLIDLCEALEHIGQHEASQEAWREAKEIATREHYNALLARGEEIQGDLYYHFFKDYARAYEYFGEFCYQMAQYNEQQYSKARRKLIDLLVELPAHEISPIVDSLTTFWSARGLGKSHPEFITELQDVEELIVS